MAELHEGDVVEYVNEFGQPRTALVTAVWGSNEFDLDGEQVWGVPSINVVWVTPEEGKRDQYGQQIERQTSVVHERNQAAHGRYWRFLKT
jgi:hypothetical protein